MRFVRDIAPDRLKHAYAETAHRMRWRRAPTAPVTRRFVRQHGLTVLSGPFAGMSYPSAVVELADLLVPKLTGSYECELHGPLERLLARSFAVFVDIGAADGYYVVGVGRRSPHCQVIAYEMNRFSANVCRVLAEHNGVADRIDVRGECTVEDIAGLPADGVLMLVDTEGAEDVLLDPGRAPNLRSATLVVELHDFAVPGVGQRVAERFAPTHDIERVAAACRWPSDFPPVMSTPHFGHVEQTLAVAEFRHSPVEWLVLTPREVS